MISGSSPPSCRREPAHASPPVAAWSTPAGLASLTAAAPRPCPDGVARGAPHPASRPRWRWPRGPAPLAATGSALCRPCTPVGIGGGGPAPLLQRLLKFFHLRHRLLLFSGTFLMRHMSAAILLQEHTAAEADADMAAAPRC